MNEEIVDEIDVCIDCMLIHANGETSGDRDENEPELWSRILDGIGFSVTMGGKHSKGCDGPEDCSCGDLGFSWSACEGCGSNLGGDRFRFTVWRWTIRYARHQFRAVIQHVHTEGTIAGRIGRLETAGLIRRYIADRLAEDRRFAAL